MVKFYIGMLALVLFDIFLIKIYYKNIFFKEKILSTIIEEEN